MRRGLRRYGTISRKYDLDTPLRNRRRQSTLRMLFQEWGSLDQETDLGCLPPFRPWRSNRDRWLHPS